MFKARDSATPLEKLLLEAAKIGGLQKVRELGIIAIKKGYTDIIKCSYIIYLVPF